MHYITLILTLLPLVCTAVDISLFLKWDDASFWDEIPNPPNDPCNTETLGYFYVACRNISANTCCHSYWPFSVSSIGAYNLNNNQAGRVFDHLHVYNGTLVNPCDEETQCGGAGGFANICIKTNGQCGEQNTVGSLWKSVDAGMERSEGVVGVVRPDVAGFWDIGEKKHRQFRIGNDVPDGVRANLVDAVKKNTQYKDLDQSVKEFEIHN